MYLTLLRRIFVIFHHTLDDHKHIDLDGVKCRKITLYYGA